MLDIFADNIFLTMFLVIALGAGLGAIPFGGIRFGAAGTLFVGLLVGALIPEPSADLTMLQNLGLGLFVYLVGLEAGESFFKQLRSQLGMIASAIAAIVVGAAVAIIGGLLLGASREITVGIFSGALTNTPSLSLAQSQTGSDLPAVGYSLAYPTGVVVAILVVSVFVNQKWKAKKDSQDSDDSKLVIRRVKLARDMTVQQLNDAAEGKVRVATVRRNGHSSIVDPEQPLNAGDVVTVFAAESIMPAVIEAAGTAVPRRWGRDRNVAIDELTVSNDDLAGRQLKEIKLFRRHRSVVTRIRRMDELILATPETYLEAGDIVEIAFPIGKRDDLVTFFGDSKRNVSEVDLVNFAGGLTLGFAAALIVIPLPAGASFALGSAAGPLIVGLILGALRNAPWGGTWKLPRSANFTLRQFGLMLFLAAVGIASGPAFAATAISMTGLISMIIGAAVTVATLATFYLLMRVQGQSTARASGGASGIMSQPAILEFASSRAVDPRVMLGYSTVVTIAVIVKIIMVPLILLVI
ncbi:antiporter [Corynebacterium tapiri]|uniref:Antiporter n=2 Tax=Corynebacterium tapiri TaxID=1448266 RepID=A0A5C4U6Q3_9CORY|nr:antiporter [Corynebacterium tapiri]